MTEPKRLKGNHALPIREPHAIELSEKKWRRVDALECVKRNESLCLLGIAGVGKTTLVNELVQFLRSQGEIVACIAKTHTAALQISGCSANSFVYRSILHGQFRGKWVVCDEVSQLEFAIFVQLQKLMHMGKKFILIGDFNQFGPIGSNIFGGKILGDCIENSDFLKLMADCNLCELTECKRSDEKLFAYYSSLIRGGDRFSLPLGEVLEEARHMFPRKKGIPDFSLVISHTHRRALNTRINTALKPEGALMLTGPDGDFYIYEGQLLIGRLQEKKRGIVNNGMYRVKTIVRQAGEEITVVCELTQNEIKLPKDFVAQHLALCHSLTQANVQGCTLKGRIRIYTHHRFFTLKHLFVCISRATAYNLVEVI
jgi:energy-coupling factor transporter ATP-binding protein EcfA2